MRELLALILWVAAASLEYWALLVLASALSKTVFVPAPNGRAAERAFERAAAQFHSMR